ncbi:thioredoxin-dependent thiol peroxidase [Roseibium album]|uniref:thioredoxin-dependent peroxiredoxin n=1 Tax=Roseibium album TaxID=311410 RepID=A0A0M6ZKU4_9HYPH|nr:thioredoxin-dependent thiol peroxidase [Roseibium album]MBG6165859.1 peroxiredoxin Q/BCP [Labrenzia sp. EL_195]MCR9060009.1 thioredoxin-dependent thiol peroxidase [Paracoccaceae bacterium]CTQ62822.1 Putative peroxiredoxin bcp [Roseibium album]CTQ68792.1 Putative peroxiredoxin bcp [Roseibium album]CTQ80406.1 Putative peroxiredoxin bcp [Roseibium album]
MQQLAIGDTAPNFDLESDGGARVSLDALKGKPVVVYFYPKDNTPGCTKEAIAFSELIEDFNNLGVTIVGMSPDSAKKHDNFIAKHNLAVRLGADTDTSTAEAYGVWVEKSMYGKKYMGVERSTFLVDKTGKIAQIWRKVKVPGHAEAVLEAAKAL